MRRFGVVLVAAILAACAPKAQPAKPALWLVEGPKGETGWLFGTIHALARPAEWRTGKVEPAFERSDRIVVEVGGLADGGAMAETFTRLARSPGQPPLSQRVNPALRDDLGRLLDKGRMRQSQFDDIETWAAALTLARIGEKDDAASNGVDRAVIAAAKGKPVVELEGASAQLGIFDTLPEREQRDLLDLVVGDIDSLDQDGDRLADTWRKGDMKAIEAETRTGLLADPELRQALFVGRNRAWTDRIAAMLARGERPFVAVGAAHMAGPEGLPAMLTAKGFKVTRVQ